MIRFSFAGVLLLVSVGFSLGANADAEFFEKTIRPILIENCTACHGPQKQKAGLRLDSRAAMLKGSDDGPAFNEKNPEKSAILEVIGYAADTKMPPKAKLSDEQIAALTKWVKAGAVWPSETAAVEGSVEKFDLAKRAGHWSLQPIRSVDVPEGKPEQSSIDRFLLAKLRGKNLSFSPSADKAALLRRLSFDITGLPPTLEELDAFLKDESPDAYRKQVDRLLASPRFGEHWGRHWLDLVRYAETMGHEFDFEMFEPWRYRDYVIRALNADLPYNRFVKEHLAGDLLPTPRVDAAKGLNESVLATAFWHLYEAKHGPVDIRQDMADRFDNQLDVFSKTFLASTLSCAKCHDHKFDAITTKDYYSLMGVLESSRYAKGFIDDPTTVLPKLRQLQKDRLLRSNQLRMEITAALEKSKSKVSIGEPTNAGPNRLLELFSERIGTEEQRYPGEGPACAVSPEVGQLVRLDNRWGVVGPGAVSSGHLSSLLPGARRSKTFTIDNDHLHFHAAGKLVQVRLIIEHYQLIQAPIYGGLQMTISDGAKEGWHTIDTTMWKGRSAYIEVIDSAHGSILLDDVRIGDEPLQLKKQSVDTADALKAWKEDRLTADPQGLRYARAINEALKTSTDIAPNDADVALDKRAKAILPAHQSMVLVEGTPQTEKVFIRGNPKKLGEDAPHRLFEVLREPAFEKGSGRLELANRMTDAGNPLLRRVAVNRVWKHLFGEGIVRSVDDFGVQGERPSHPELLDWLATDFSSNGWSMKKLIRQMVLTQAYRQRSRSDGEVAADPQNRLLHHYPIKRIEAESIRDTMLLLAGRLDTTMEGPGVPQHLTESMVGRGRPKESGPLDGAGRRTIYLQIRRNFPNPMMAAFDTPIPFTTIGKRGVSNVPSQALILLNNPLVHQLARDWAKRVLADPDTDHRIDRMYRMAYARLPQPDESQLAREFIAEAIDDGETVAWSQLAHAMLNAKEFIFVP